jgi:hypothetical protein
VGRQVTHSDLVHPLVSRNLVSDGGTPQWGRILAGYAACGNAGLAAKLNAHSDEMVSLVYQANQVVYPRKERIGHIIERL